MKKPQVGFVCFGEVNTPIEKLQEKHDYALQVLSAIDADFFDGGLVIDDPEYATADKAIAALKQYTFDSLIVCVAGWVPTHAVIRVTDEYRTMPMLLWGLCGWKEDGRIVTTAEQAGTTAIRPAFVEMGYRFKYVYNVIGEPEPVASIESFLRAANSVAQLRHARVGSMGYRDMLLYGTQFEGNSLRAKIGVEVEPFEMLEMRENLKTVDPAKVAEGVKYVRENYVIEKECDDAIIAKAVEYTLAIGKKIEERGYDGITLIDVDGMKKLEGYPPALVFMLLNHYYGVETVPENDVMGSVTELMLRYALGTGVHYMEYYEFFKDSMLIGVPDFVPEGVVDGQVHLLPAAFGLLNTALLNVSKVKTGYVTCARLVYTKGQYKMHIYSGNAVTPPAWNEYGWAAPAPQLPSLQVFPDNCTVPEFANKVSSQHVIVSYGDNKEMLADLCGLLDIEVF